MNYTYIIKCSDNTYYCGYAKNLTSRMITHNNKKGAKYTRGRTPIELLYYEVFATKGEALSREHFFKKMTREQKEQYVAENINNEKQREIAQINEKLRSLEKKEK